MTFPGQEPRRGRAWLLLAMAGAVTLLLAVSLTWANAKDQPRTDPAPCAQGEGLSSACRALAEQAATPVVADPLDGDPLDGAPEAGDERGRRLPEPDNASALTITQSGRQKDTPNSTVLYDGDDATVWNPGDLPEAWVWFDLGDAEPVRSIRWLAEGAGEVEVSISSDHRSWAVLDTLPVDVGWQEITLREDAQYVRLTLLPDDETQPVAIAEVEVFGRERKADAELAQDANDRERKKDKRRAAQAAQQAASADDAGSDASGNGGGRNPAPEVSTRPGKTKCSGSRERCRAKPGRVEVNDDCDGNGTCTIDIRADGGSATCDASGGSMNKAGKGEGKRNDDNGGRCEATANGGSVTIGDVNP